MRRRNYMTALSAAVLSIGLLAGCSELFNKTDEAFEKSVDGALTPGDTAQKAALDWIEQARTDGLNKELSTTKETGTASTLHFENTIGNIEVKSGTSDMIIVSASIWSMKDKADYQKIVDQAELSVNVKGDFLEILIHPKDNPKKNLWNWAEDKYGVSNFTIDYIVELPASINSYEVSNQVGDIMLSNLIGSYKVSSSVGSVSIEGAHIIGKSSVKSNAGNLRLGINQMDRDSSLIVKTEVGSIVTTLGASLQCSLDIDSELGRITGASKGESEINGGGPSLSLSSSVGSITVERA